MSGRKTRTTANAPENATLSINERILKDCHNLYVNEERGLIGISQKLNLSLLAPRRKITVLLIGNHSAGKSSFINWYVEEHVQRTGVAIETQGFTFVTSGRKRESLTGNATLHLYPHFEPLRRLDGVVDYLTTEISTSKQKKFSLVTFVDTPGLVDGDMVYPFNVDESIKWLGDLADLIFVFFDPMGQALCKRTLNIVEALNQTHSERIKFYLTKADTAGSDSDRQRVMMQIVQELCKRPGLNKAAFDMPAIFIPSLTAKSPRCENQINEAAREVSKSIDQMIQSTLNTLEKDCESISSTVDVKLEKDRVDRAYNLRARSKGLLFFGLSLLFPMLLFFNLFVKAGGGSFLQSVLGDQLANVTISYVTLMFSAIPDDSYMYAIVAHAVVCLILLTIARYVSRTRSTLSRGERRALGEIRTYVQDSVKTRKAQLYKEYLQQSVGSDFLS